MSKFVGINDCQAVSGLAIVIDVFRAFTVAPLAISQGATEIVLAETPEEALQLKADTPMALACIDGPPQNGFDLCNSPGQLLACDVTGRTVIQKTTAGTRAALSVKHCRPLLCSSFVCASATAQYIRSQYAEPTFVISGENGEAAEDLAAAKLIDALIVDPAANPARFIKAADQSKAAQALRKGLALGYPGIDPQDIDISLDVDRFDFCLAASHEPAGVTLHALKALAE